MYRSKIELHNGDYFPYLWQNGCKGFVFWSKGNPVPNFSDGELAWTSFNKVAKQLCYIIYIMIIRKAKQVQAIKYIQHKNPLICINGCLVNMPKKEIK